MVESCASRIASTYIHLELFYAQLLQETYAEQPAYRVR